MLRYCLSALLVFVSCGCLCGQSGQFEYYYNNNLYSDTAPVIDSDENLFYNPLQYRSDLFGKISEFNFSAVKYFRRGYDISSRAAYLGNLYIGSLISASPDYGTLSNLRRANGLSITTGTIMVAQVSEGLTALPGAGGTEFFDSDAAAIIPDGIRIALFSYNRRGRLGAKGSVKLKSSSGHTYSLWGSRRWGTDGEIKGVFTDEISFLGGAGFHLSDKHSLDIIISGVISQNGSRSAATREAFALTGDNMYNPSWGYDGGKVRSSKVTERIQPFSAISYKGKLGATSLCISASYRYNREAYITPGWFNAATPYPDYYRYMPSYAENAETADIMANEWISGNKSVTQIDWGTMAEANRLNPERAVYYMEGRMEDINALQFAATAENKLSKDVRLNYGLRYMAESRAYYKKLTDMLGGLPMPDIDQYLTDDEIAGGRILNDMRNPARVVRENDTFGYNYTMHSARAEAFALLRYEHNKMGLGFGIAIANSTLHRNGSYEKELFPGSGSLGNSKKLSAGTYMVNASLRYSFTPVHIVELSALASTRAPYAGNIFLNPQYSNAMIDNPDMVRTLSFEAAYTGVIGPCMLNLTGFYTRTSGETAVYRYWDENPGRAFFADMTVSGIDKLHYGAEAAASVELSSRFTLGAAVSLGNYVYDSDPVADIYIDATQQKMVSGQPSFMTGYRLGTTPQLAATTELRYSSMGWIASLTANYMGGRYVDPSLLRRMERTYSLATSQERYIDFVTQEKLPDAFTLDLFLLRSFNIAGSSLTAMVSVNNLLGDKNIIYSGYEQMRVLGKGTKPDRSYQPFPNKYLHAYGRTYYISLTYRF